MKFIKLTIVGTLSVFISYFSISVSATGVAPSQENSNSTQSACCCVTKTASHWVDGVSTCQKLLGTSSVCIATSQYNRAKSVVHSRSKLTSQTCAGLTKQTRELIHNYFTAIYFQSHQF